jgi:4-azaleucine resistance transporter AzlC
MDQPYKQDFRQTDLVRGFGRGATIAVAMLPIALLFGALAVQQGLSVGEAVLMSAAIFAGASQLVGIELFGQTVPAWLIVFSVFAVNFRHVLYSAALGRRTRHWGAPRRALAFFFLTDPQFAESERQAERHPPLSLAWYCGLAAPIYVQWVAGAAVGAWFGGLIPDPYSFGVDFLMPIYFLGLVVGFHERPLWLPVVLASGIVSVLAYEYVGSPWHVSIGAVAGVLVAVILTPSGKGRPA